MSDDERWLTEAVALAVTNVAEGGGPFGAVVVRGGEVVAQAGNRVTRDLDPTAHAEVLAIRSAGPALGRFALDGCVLYASCEPCPMCLAAALWARLDRVVYAADRDDAAGGGFDDREFYDLFATERTTWATPVVAGASPDPGAPFRAWRDRADRTAY